MQGMKGDRMKKEDYDLVIGSIEIKGSIKKELSSFVSTVFIPPILTVSGMVGCLYSPGFI